MLAVAILLVGAGVGVHIEESRGVSADESTAFTTQLEQAIRARANESVIVDRHATPCERPDRCIEAIRARTSASDIVLLRLLGVPTRIRLLAERIGSSGQSIARAEVDEARAPSLWSKAIDELIEKLFPQRAPEPALIAAAPRAPPQDELQWEPWALIGGGALAGAIGVGFGLSSRSARDTAANEPHTMAELAELEDRAIGHGLAANILFGAAVAGIGAGVVWLIVREN